MPSGGRIQKLLRSIVVETSTHGISLYVHLKIFLTKNLNADVDDVVRLIW